MGSILQVYKSKTGFTKKYVDWISEMITCQTVPLEKMNNVNINDYDIIIYGAGMFAGRIKGLKKFKRKVLNLVNKEIVVFATGSAPFLEEILLNIKKDNFTENELENIKFFYFQSGMNYEKMGFLNKLIMKVYSIILKTKKNKSDIEEGTSKAILNSYDQSSREYIVPMINCLKDMLNSN